MMYIIYNHDGSIKDKNLTEFIQQGDNLTKEIAVAIIGIEPIAISLVAHFTLPNGAKTTLIGTESVNILGQYPGKVIELTDAETALNGLLKMNIQALNASNDQILTSYTAYLTINSGVEPGEIAMMSEKALNDLIAMIERDVQNDECILRMDHVPVSAEGFEVGQVVYVKSELLSEVYELQEISDELVWTPIINFKNYYTKTEAEALFAQLATQNVFTYSPQTNEEITDASADTKLATKKYVRDLMDAHLGDYTVLNGKVTAIEEKIPSQASSSNKLADKDFVNSTVNSLAAFYITKNAAGDPFDSVAQLMSATVFYSGGQLRNPTRNDYCMVNNDENHDGAACRYIYQGGNYPEGQWEFQFVVNETPYTAEQIAAINSGITAALVAQITTNQNAISGINSKLPIIKDFVIPTNAWQLDALTGRYYAELDAGNDFVIDDNKVKLFTGTSASDNNLIGSFGIVGSSNGTTQKIRFECFRDNSNAPGYVINFTVAQFGGNQ